MRETREGEGEGRIYIQRTFDLTELDDLSQEREGEEGVGMGKRRKESEATTASWKEEASRGSSQEVLVRDPPGVGF